MSHSLVCLRPSLQPLACTCGVAAAAVSHAGLYNVFRKRSSIPRRRRRFCYRSFNGNATPEHAQRINPRIRTGTSETVKEPVHDLWPRMPSQKNAIDVKKFQYLYKKVSRGETLEDEVTVRGRVWTYRIAGSKLAFIDILQDGAIVQCLCNFSNLAQSNLRPMEFKEFANSLRRADVLSIRGHPHRTTRNELSVLATELPFRLSRCLQALPEKLANEETKIRNRHVDFLLHQRSSDILRLRFSVIEFLRDYLNEQGFMGAQTPILAAGAGGAVARPFYTRTTELEGRLLALRIAPELWLKRLIIGGFEKVYEIGPSFRNEGIDLNHNPEFWTCEFYKTYAHLDELIGMTEGMFHSLSRLMALRISRDLRSLKVLDSDFTPPYHRLDFIPAIEAEIGATLPDLASPQAETELGQILRDRHISLPASPTLPRLLDRLSSEYLEPQCSTPTWIVNHPECLSPLSKSFNHAANGQRVAARAELYVNKQELVNTYEEENSPVVQRRKFELQLRHKDSENPATILDESYLQALEWGMPPTGGWGCGIDRLCMLFADTTRIADTLSFGTLRNVVALGRTPELSSESADKLPPTRIAGAA